jgi:hypothetical protein
MVVLFALVLVVLAGVAGILLDGGMASATRRQAQAAVDTAALAAARAVSVGQNVTTKAREYAALNGFNATTTDCSGNSISGVDVNRPPTSGAYAGNNSYVEVIARRAMRTGFAGLIGQSCWMVSARAVAVVDASGVSPCTFCSLNDTATNHTLVLKNGATLRVDGEIYVNSSNGGTQAGVCNVKDWEVCGDGFDVFGAGGYISAKKITVVGGWETHDGNVAYADEITPGCEWYTPLAQAQPAKVCIHMPVMVDPLNNPAQPGFIVDPPAASSTRPIAGQNGCPSTALSATGTAASPSKLSITSGTPTICPGSYFGGIEIKNSASVTMLPGIYIMVGGGFAVLNSASVDGSTGVMIYNSSGSGTAVNTSAGTSSVPAPVAGKVNPKSPELRSSDSSSSPGQTVTFTFTMEKNTTALPTGTVTFYDGDTVICGNVALVPNGDGKKVNAPCSQTYTTWGTRAINAIYWGDAVYNAAGDATTQTITSPSANIGPVTITTTGVVKLSGPTSGSYAGLTIFQDRTSNLVVTLQPGSSGVTCPSGYMTADLSNPSGWKTGCGAIGGLRGTVYAPQKNALVYITAGGLAQLQVLAGQIQVDSGANARFGWNSAFFVNGQIHLAE